MSDTEWVLLSGEDPLVGLWTIDEGGLKDPSKFGAKFNELGEV